MPFSNHSTEHYLFCEGVENLMLGLPCCLGSLEPTTSLQVSVECQLVSIKLFSSMMFSEAWISQAAEAQHVLRDNLCYWHYFHTPLCLLIIFFYFNIRTVGHLEENMSFCSWLSFFCLAWHYFTVVLDQERNADLAMCVFLHLFRK